MSDSEAIQEIHQHAFVFLEQPGAKEIAGDQFEGGFAECGDHRVVAVGARLPFHKNVTDLAGIGHCLQGRLI